MHWEARRRQSALDRRMARDQQQVNNMLYKAVIQRQQSKFLWQIFLSMTVFKTNKQKWLHCIKVWSRMGLPQLMLRITRHFSICIYFSADGDPAACLLYFIIEQKQGLIGNWAGTRDTPARGQTCFLCGADSLYPVADFRFVFKHKNIFVIVGFKVYLIIIFFRPELSVNFN